MSGINTTIRLYCALVDKIRNLDEPQNFTLRSLAKDLGVAHTTVHRHILKLQEFGIIEADTSPVKLIQEVKSWKVPVVEWHEESAVWGRIIDSQSINPTLTGRLSILNPIASKAARHYLSALSQILKGDMLIIEATSSHHCNTAITWKPATGKEIKDVEDIKPNDIVIGGIVSIIRRC